MYGFSSMLGIVLKCYTGYKFKTDIDLTNEQLIAQ